MRKRAIATTVVAFVLFVALVAAALNTIFTVTLVRTDFTTYSEDGRNEAAALRGELDRFLGKSSVFLDLGDVASEVEKYQFFRIEEIEKRYPTTVYVRISERRETFAVARENGFETYADNGVYLRTLSTIKNRAGGNNILLEGFPFAQGASVLTGTYAEQVIAVTAAFREALTEERANIVSVELVSKTSDARNDFFRIHTQEGVVIDLGDPAARPEEKAALAIGSYLSLGDEDRTFGYITVLGGEDGELYSDYTRSSAL